MLNTNYNDYLNLAKYATMTAINQEAVSPLEGSGGMAAIEGGLWAFRNGKNLFHWSTLKEALVPTKAQVSTYKNIWKNSENIFQAVSNQNAVAKIAKMGKSTDTGIQTAIDATLRKAASSTPGNLAAEVTKIENMQKAVKAANPSKFTKFVKSTKVGEFFSKTKTAVKSGFNAFKNSLGIGTKAAGKAATSTTARTAGKAISKCGKFVKGNAAFLAISAGAEAITNVAPTFKQLGKKAGWRQVGKSSLKVAGSVGGWALGAAIGSAICPGAGTLVGALVGMGCSIICSWAGEKLASAIAGKDELELAQEKQAESIAQAAQEDSEVRAELIGAVQERLGEEGLTADGMVAQNSLARVMRDTPQSATTNTSVSQVKQTVLDTGNNVTTLPEIAVDNNSQNNTSTQAASTTTQSTTTPLFTSSLYPTFNPYSTGMNMFGNYNFNNQFNPFGFGLYNPSSTVAFNNPFGMQFPYGIGSTFNPYMPYMFSNPFGNVSTSYAA